MGKIRFDLILSADGVLPVDQVAHVVGSFANDQHGGYWQLGMDAAFENKVWYKVGEVDMSDGCSPKPTADTLPRGTRARDEFGRLWLVGKSWCDDSSIWKQCGFDPTGTPIEHMFAPKSLPITADLPLKPVQSYDKIEAERNALKVCLTKMVLYCDKPAHWIGLANLPHDRILGVGTIAEWTEEARKLLHPLRATDQLLSAEIDDQWKRQAVGQVMCGWSSDLADEALYDLLVSTAAADLAKVFEAHSIEIWRAFEDYPPQTVIQLLKNAATSAQISANCS